MLLLLAACPLALLATPTRLLAPLPTPPPPRVPARHMCASVRFRPASRDDVGPIRQRMLRELMNPLSLEHERFLVAEDGEGERVGFGQLRPLPDPGLWELASLYVEKPWRRRGIGTSLVRQLLQRHVAAGRREGHVFLLCLEPSVEWYAALGFVPLASVAEAPESMAFEIAAGGVLTRLLGERLVCMRGRQ
ncbi:hypothetical protein AB1Y20_019617 [Prymnesium parvum]|uniref:N-acetyltransferase domain-containing protein n=1 Tax=Prymnesium parvum TaxID=97485 RepID=A0AB34JSV1_PRYPA